MPDKSPLAWAHQHPPPLPDWADPDDAILLRYDGAVIDGENVIYGVIGVHDLARLDASFIEDLQVGTDGFAFFVGSEQDLRLYVDLDEFPDFVPILQDAADDAGLTLLNGVGDLNHMRSKDGDIRAPEIPAFVESGFNFIPSTIALSHLAAKRPGSSADGPSVF